MIWTILLIVLITVAALFCIVVSLILFPVFTLGIYAVLRPDQKKVQIEGSWLHPGIITFALNPFNQEFTLTFMGRRLFGLKQKTSSVKSEAESQQEPPPARPEPGIHQEPASSDKIDEFEVVSSRPEPEVKCESEIHEAEKMGKVEDEEKYSIKFEAEVEEERSIKVEAEAEEKNWKKSKDMSKAKVEEKKSKVKVKKKVEVKAKNENTINDNLGGEGEKVKEGFFIRLKKNRYLYMIRQRKLQKKLFRWGFRILRSLFRIIRFNHFDASIKAGIEEPALLGNVYAVYTMTRYTVNVSGGGQPILKFEPVFMKNWFEGEGRFSVKTSVISLMWPAFIAVSSFPYMTVLWLFWKSRKLKAKRPKKS
jgi:hypothetical protein